MRSRRSASTATHSGLTPPHNSGSPPPIEQVGVDGHVFAFDEEPKGKDLSDAGCAEPCADDERMACGCADDHCGGLRAVKGEEHVRRWVVYQVEEDPRDGQKTKKKKKRGA